jgi:hypothetical protein
VATITGSTSLNPTKYSYYAVWSESNINSTNNTSDVTVDVYVQKVSNYSCEGSNNSNTLYIDGTAYTTSGLYIDMNPETTPRLVASGTKTVLHNPDGTKNITISCSGSLPYGGGFGPQSGSLSSTVSLTTITRNSAVTTSAASSVTYNSASANGSVTDGGIPNNTDKGIFWGLSSGSQPYQISSGSGSAGGFSISLTSLSPNTTYYYKAYTYNARYGIIYGSVVSFTTSAVAPALTTSAVSSVYSTKATGNGNITSVYGANATRRGFCYMTGTSGDPTIANSTAYDDGTFGTGAFSKVITGITPSTNYRVRPYATNSAGTGYGTTVQLTTLTDEHSLTVSDTMHVGESYNLRKALKMAGVLLSGVYGGWYVGANYWAGGFTRNFIEEFVDSLKVKDTMSKIAGYVKGLVESIVLSESLTAGFARAVAFLDSIIARSALDRVYALARGWIESIHIVDNFSRFVGNVRSFVESISLTEAFNASMVYIKGLVDSIVASDLYANSVGKVLQSVVTITDAFTSTMALVREFVESVVLQEVFNTAKLFVQMFEDSITLVDNILQASGRYFVDTINVIDNWWKAFVIILTDIISIEDVLSGFTATYTRVMQEIISLSDLVSKNATIVLASIVKILEGEFTRKLNGQLIEWARRIAKVGEWLKRGKDTDDYITIEKKLNDWEVREKDLGLYESKVKPLDEWTKLRKK